MIKEYKRLKALVADSKKQLDDLRKVASKNEATKAAFDRTGMEARGLERIKMFEDMLNKYADKNIALRLLKKVGF